MARIEAVQGLKPLATTPRPFGANASETEIPLHTHPPTRRRVQAGGFIHRTRSKRRTIPRALKGLGKSPGGSTLPAWLGCGFAAPRLHMPLALAALVLSAGVSLYGEIASEDVNRAVDKAIGFLRESQQEDGSWPYAAEYEPGLTALATMALVNAGVPKEDAAIRNALKYIQKRPPSRTYAVALAAMALSEVDANKYRAEIQRHAAWLARSQGRDGTWAYMEQANFGGGGDNSNTQFAVLGLHAARRAGIPIKNSIWDKVLDHFKATQNENGGWGYSGLSGPTVSMTAAAVASLLVAGDHLSYATEVCGRYLEHKSISAGIAYLGDTWGGDSGHNTYYTVYAIERVGILSGQKFLGKHDWYRDLATQLVLQQDAAGGWGTEPPRSPTAVVNTCFALLTLAKGKTPVLVNKLKWNGDWNNDRNDMKNLTDFISQRLEKRVAWQVLPAAAPVEDWLSAPLLYMNGHSIPSLKPAEIQKLHQFLERGGMLFAEACCGKKAFDAGFRALVREAFPGRELERLPASHEVFHAFFDINPKTAPIEGLSLGCRTAILYSAADFSCDWETRENSRNSFKIGMNLALYAMGDIPLRDKLDSIVVGAKTQPKLQPSEDVLPRGALTLAQIKHNGDWDTDPLALQNLQAYLRKELNVTVTSSRYPIALTSADLPNFPILFMTGHNSFSLAEAERAALKQHLLRGGFLMAEACCGREAFHEAFRREMQTLFPDNALADIPTSHSIFSCGYPLTRVRYTPAVLKQRPGYDQPLLQGITHEGRTLVVYSPYSLGCALEDHACPQCLGLEREDALKIAANLVIYALGF